VLKGLAFRVLASEIAVEILDRVNDGGVRLQPHPALEAVMEHGGDQWPFGWISGFLFDDGGQSHRLVHGEAELRRPPLPLRGKAERNACSMAAMIPSAVIVRGKK